MIIVCPKCLSCATTRLYGESRAGCSACQVIWDEPLTYDHATQVQGFNPESPGWKILQKQHENIVLYNMHESASSFGEYPAV
jgi:hypothetical protein